MNIAGNYSALNLAYLGDAVFELCVRNKLIQRGNMPVDKLNKYAKKMVTAEAQAKMYYRLLQYLNDAELAAIKRGRNANPRSVSKSSSVSDYRHATGVESLFGYLYINADYERINELFEICYNATGGLPDERKMIINEGTENKHGQDEEKSSPEDNRQQ